LKASSLEGDRHNPSDSRLSQPVTAAAAELNDELLEDQATNAVLVHNGCALAVPTARAIAQCVLATAFKILLQCQQLPS
jgi:hypothetical protein